MKIQFVAMGLLLAPALAVPVSANETCVFDWGVCVDPEVLTSQLPRTVPTPDLSRIKIDPESVDPHPLVEGVGGAGEAGIRFAGEVSDNTNELATDVSDQTQRTAGVFGTGASKITGEAPGRVLESTSRIATAGDDLPQVVVDEAGRATNYFAGAAGGLGKEIANSLTLKPGRYVVGYTEALEGFVENLSLESLPGARITYVNRPLNALFVLVENPAAFGFWLRLNDAAIDYLGEDLKIAQTLATPDDPKYVHQWQRYPMNLEQAWDQTWGSSSVKVAVIDSGIKKDHEDFDSGRILPGWDFVGQDADPADENGHGTHVAGILAATANNRKGIAGVAQVKILPLRVAGPDGDGAIGSLYNAITYATDQGARIISISAGFSLDKNDPVQLKVIQWFHKAIQYATDRNVLIVAAAGNSACNDCVSYPAAYDEVVAVGCMQRYYFPTSGGIGEGIRRCPYQSSGPELDITAPGDDILSTCHSSLKICETSSETGVWCTADELYCSLSGTSMAAPQVSGTAALALSVNSRLSAHRLRNLLLASTTDLGDVGLDPQYGHGLLNTARAVAWAASG